MHAISTAREASSDMTGARAAKAGRARTCLVTREVADPDMLVRFVLSPEGEVVPDIDARLPGRGFWLSARKDIVRAACARNVFARGARRPVVPPADLSERVEGLLARKCLDTLGLARRAGQACAGFEKVRAALGQGRVAILLVAADAAPGGAAKLGRAPSGVTEVRLLNGEELGSVFGRDRTVYAGVAPGRLAERLAGHSRRLAGFRDVPQVGKLS